MKNKFGLFKNFLKSTDFICEKVELRFENSSKYSTFFSSFLSIAISLFSCIIFAFGIVDICENSKYNISKMLYDINYSNKQYYDTNIPFTFIFLINGVPVIENIDNYLEIKIMKKEEFPKLRNNFNHNNTDNQNLCLYKCSSNATYFRNFTNGNSYSALYDFFYSDINYNLINNSFCLNSSNHTEDSYIYFNVKNSSKEQGFDYSIKIFFIETIINERNYTYPLQYIINDELIQLDTLLSKRLSIDYHPILFKSFNGLIFFNERIYMGVTQYRSYMDIGMNAQEKNYTLRVNFKSNNEVIVYKRYYKRLQNILAETGGMIQCLKIIGIMINYLYNSNYKYLSLANSFYHKLKTIDPKRMFVTDPTQIRILKLNENSKKAGINNLNNSNTNYKFNTARNSNQINFNVNNNLQMPKTQFPISRSIVNDSANFFMLEPNQSPNNKKETQITEKIFDYIKCVDILLFICRKNSNKKKKFMIDLKERVLNRLSLEYLFQKYREIDLIKCILFDGDQIKMFNSLPKPCFFKDFPFEVYKFPYSFSTFDNYLLLSNDYNVQYINSENRKIEFINELQAKKLRVKNSTVNLNYIN